MTTSTFLLLTALIVAILCIGISIDRFTTAICKKADQFLATWERIEKHKREQK